jgi:hypothetical protein
MDASIGVTKRQKFMVMAQRRTTKVLKTIRLLSMLNNRRVYEYSEEDVAKIYGAITVELNDMRDKLSHTPQPKNQINFLLDGGSNG